MIPVLLPLLMAVPACLSHACSNDSLLPPIVGDERMTWQELEEWAAGRDCPDANEPCIPPGETRCYEVLRNDGQLTELCEDASVRIKPNGGLGWIYRPPPTAFFPYKSPIPALGQSHTYLLRACEGLACSGYVGPVEFVGMPYLCWPACP
jgi:hypothetical protein